MKNLYQTLGLTEEASAQEIKKAYRKLALAYHPDRGGDEDMMRLINEAYETLSDPEKKHEYDFNWRIFKEADVNTGVNVVVEGYIQPGDTLPYSQTFREQHKKLAEEYSQIPLNNFIRDNSHLFESSLYHYEDRNGVVSQYHDIFALYRAKTAQTGWLSPLLKMWKTIISPPAPVPTELLTPVFAIKLFIEFLSGSYDGSKLVRVKEYFSSEILKIKSDNPQASELLLYEGIFEILLLTNKTPADQHNLIFSIKKITDFSKNTHDLILPCIIPLFYNKFFRNLYAYALSLYWNSNEDLFNTASLKQFDGSEEAKELLNVLKERLSRSSRNEHLSELIRCVKYLYNFDKDFHESNALQQTADSCRERAFHLLDWIPIFIDQSSRQILVNIFLQIGIKFQQASRLEMKPTIRMADEQLALKMYLTAIGIGHHSTPDVEIYVNTLVLKYISAFNFQNLMLTEVISALKKRTLVITDVFPFFDSHQSNVAFLRQDNKMLYLMRQFLHAMINIHEYNKSHSDGILLDHSAVTLMYQAYEACLKNWYQEVYDATTEQNFRLELMKQLLAENAFEFLNVEKNLLAPWIMVDRNQQGWIKASRSCPFTEGSAFEIFRTVRGAEVNHKTGQIIFFLDQWSDNLPAYEKAFTLFDIQEMLEKNISGAIFSLDPIDPDKPYHPFNIMRFSPSHLFESEFLNTMLLTDYILKFLTTNQEVQGKYPFEQRPVAQMIQHLPEYLRQIITDFQSAQHSGALHRFWIEAEEIDISLDDGEKNEEDITRIGLGGLKMLLKKHRLERDIHGNLKDAGNEDEGWPIYVLSPEQMYDLELGKRVINGHAMIFIYAKTKLFYWDHNKVIHTHIPEEFHETLIRLYKQPKDHDGKIMQNTKNMPLIYRTTKEMARQSVLSHRYSPEFIFAHEFTTHYDEFAQYLPEFGRLKELSKLTVLIRILDSMRQANKESLEALDFLLNPSSKSPVPETNAYRQYNQNYEKMCQNITSIFHTWRQNLASTVLQRGWREKLNDIKAQIGTLTYSSYSTEVDEACQLWYNQVSKNNPRISSSRIWDEVINPQRSEIAKQISMSKQNSCRSQLNKFFSSHLSATMSSNAFSNLIDSFINGNIAPLADALMNQEKTQAVNDISKQFPKSSTKEIALALDDNGEAAAMSIAIDESRNQLMQEKRLKDQQESGFVKINLGAHAEPVDLKGKCFWVPATARHDVRKDDITGLTSYSFFTYGGVNVQPKLNVLYQKVGPNGEHLKFGITKNPTTRYTAEELGGGKLKIVAQGSRKEMLRLERNVHETLPIGREEKQRFYIAKQVEKGYKAPPYK